MGKMGLTTLGASDLKETTSEGNILPNKENLWQESRSRVWKRIKRFPHKPLKAGVVMRKKCPYKPAPAKQKNDINHVIKRRLANTINNIFPAFKPIYKRVLGLFNNNMVVVDECPETTCAKSQLKRRII
jgi:hypothetical protein